jgi:CelD/BcsL family acetyltransferase involved in cellulose biosynthesis
MMNADDLSQALRLYLTDNRDWDVIFQNGVIKGSITDAVFSRLKKDEFIIHQQETVKAPRMKMNSGWECFYHSLDKKIKKDTERQIRRLADLGELKLVEITGKEIQPSLDLFFRLHQQRWHEKDGGSIFDDELSRKFYQEIAQENDKQGRLAFHKLMLDKEVLAIHFGFKYKKHFYYYIPAFNTQYSKFSVGRILILELIKRCFQEKFDTFDFMAGEERYKYLFTNAEETLSSIYVINRKLKGYLYKFLKFRLKPYLTRNPAC